MIKLNNNNGSQLRELDNTLYLLNLPAWIAINEGKHLWGGVEPMFEPHFEKLLNDRPDDLEAVLRDFIKWGRRVSY